MARQDKLNNFSVTPTVNGSPLWTKDSLQVGGRNLAQGTSNEWSAPYTPIPNANNQLTLLAIVLTDGLSVDDYVTYRLVLDYENVTSPDGLAARAIIQGFGDVSSWEDGQFPNTSYVIPTGSGQHEITCTFKATPNHLKNAKWNVSLRNCNFATGSIRFKEFSVVKGNQIPDWSPAPEDIQSQIDAINAKLDALKA